MNDNVECTRGAGSGANREPVEAGLPGRNRELAALSCGSVRKHGGRLPLPLRHVAGEDRP